MIRWLHDLQSVLEQHDCAVVVTVAAVRGSAPREVGAGMIVTRESAAGTVGGGNLEFEAINRARALLAADTFPTAAQLDDYPLGPKLGQCCGGHVTLFSRLVRRGESWIGLLEGQTATGAAVLVSDISADAVAGPTLPWLVVGRDRCVGRWANQDRQRAAEHAARQLLFDSGSGSAATRFAVGAGAVICERVAPEDFQVYLFGAGHVGRALVPVLGELPCRVAWVDSRAEQFPAGVPGNVTVCVSSAPEYVVDDAVTNGLFLVMTHDHGLDLKLCERILRRDDCRYLGLIGSNSKRRRFERRLARMGIADRQVRRLVCPVGAGGIDSKHPGAIAVAVAAELLEYHQQARRSIDADLARAEVRG